MDFKRPARCRWQRTGREDRRSKFYEVSDNLPPDPELLFDALHREEVDYVVIGAFAISAHGATQSVGEIELTIDRTIENCAGFTEVLANLDARRLLSFRDHKPVDRYTPMRILDGEFRFDTAAGCGHLWRRRHAVVASARWRAKRLTAHRPSTIKSDRTAQSRSAKRR